MTTIDPTSANYAQLLAQLQNAGGTGATTDPLLSLASNPSSTDASSALDDNSFLLDLSPQAQNLLGQGQNNGTDTSGDSFILTSEQQQQVNAILAKYKDTPLTDATVTQVMSDLQKAGLAPSQLAMQDSIQSFNITQVLIDALNGVDDPMPSMDPTSNPDEQAKMNNYTQQIAHQLQSQSTVTASSDPTDGSPPPTS